MNLVNYWSLSTKEQNEIKRRVNTSPYTTMAGKEKCFDAIKAAESKVLLCKCKHKIGVFMDWVNSDTVRRVRFYNTSNGLRREGESIVNCPNCSSVLSKQVGLRIDLITI
ncbi:MAG: hypothetical protein GY928_33690 [Colwellia sp.]|nr:hypothetical protein [Colwellia sp.]